MTSVLQLRLTTANPLLPVCLNNKELSFIVYTGILHNAHSWLGDWPFGMIVTFLKSNIFGIRGCSNLRISRNSFIKSVTQRLYRTARSGIFSIFNFKLHVFQTYIFVSQILVDNTCRETLYLPTLNPKTDLLYTQHLQIMQKTYGPSNIFCLNCEILSQSDKSLSCGLTVPTIRVQKIICLSRSV